MTVRSELETPLVDYANDNSIAIALEGCSLDRTGLIEFLEVIFLDKSVTNPTLEFSAKRTRGYMQVNVYVQDGMGSKRVEELAEAVAALYPAANKQAFATVSIEQHPQFSRAMIDGNFRVISVSIKYRQES